MLDSEAAGVWASGSDVDEVKVSPEMAEAIASRVSRRCRDVERKPNNPMKNLNARCLPLISLLFSLGRIIHPVPVGCKSVD